MAINGSGVHLDEAPDAADVAYDNTSSGLAATEVQSAIDEVFAAAADSSRSYTFASYGGNANTGRYLELYSSIDMSDAPLYTPTGIDIVTIVSRTVATSSTCTIGWYDIEPTTPVLLHTTTFSADKQVVENGMTLFSLPAEGQLAAKIDSGSINKPHVYFIVKGSV